MPKITINPQIAAYLKRIRTESGVSAKEISEKLNKSPAYITKLEHGNIKTIDIYDLQKYINIVCKNNEKAIDGAIDYIYGELKPNVISSPEEISDLEAYENFDKVNRKIPVPDELKEYILNELKEIGYTLSDLVDKANLNEFVEGLKDRDDVEYNRWYFVNGAYSILLKLDYNEVNNILKTPNSISNYITMQALLYNICLIKGENDVSAGSSSHKILKDFHFCTLRERHENLGKSQSTKDDQLFHQNIENLISALTAISDQDVIYTNKRLEAIIKNLKNDIGFAFAFMSLDLSSVIEFDYDTKKDLLQKIKELIEEYSQKGKDKIQKFDV